LINYFHLLSQLYFTVFIEKALPPFCFEILYRFKVPILQRGSKEKVLSCVISILTVSMLLFQFFLVFFLMDDGKVHGRLWRQQSLQWTVRT
jgi:hypothetical protein